MFSIISYLFKKSLIINTKDKVMQSNARHSSCFQGAYNWGNIKDDDKHKKYLQNVSNVFADKLYTLC